MVGMNETEERASFADLLRRYRTEAELTQEALAEKAELSTRSVQKLERGESLPYPVTVQRLARALGLTELQRAEFQTASRREPKAAPAREPAFRPDLSQLAAIGARTTEILTLLFTDIEGSTRRWERHPEAMKVALARHDLLLHGAIESGGGRIFSTAGDGLCAAFSNPLAAVSASMAAQRALLAEPWVGVEPLMVRMALHTGAVEVENGAYQSGPPMNRVARILAAAHGGQVLLSAVTEGMVGEALPDSAECHALGEHRLRDLARPESIFQLVAPGLPSVFPPLRVDHSLDSHFEAVARAVADGRVVLFLGQQVNRSGRRPGMGWSPGVAELLPTDSELASHLAKGFAYPNTTSPELPRVAQYVSVVAGAGPLRETLHSLLDVDYRPNLVHEFVASLPRLLRERGEVANYPIVVTTNYDDTLERAFVAAEEPIDVVVYASEGEGRGRFWHLGPDGNRRLIDRPNKYVSVPSTERTLILRVHGVIDRIDPDADSFVVTEDDYLDYLTRADVSSLLPVGIAARLRKSHYLFLGYSLRDWNLRVILHRLWGEQRLAYKSWAIEAMHDALEQELWRKRDVDVLDVRLDEYVSELRDRFLVMPRGAEPTSEGPS
jgi:class 3 adenylate cyclase